MVNLNRSKRNAGRDEDQATFIEDILFSVNPDGNFSSEAEWICWIGTYQTDDLVSITNTGTINYLIRVAALEPGTVYRKEVLKAVSIDLHYMG